MAAKHKCVFCETIIENKEDEVAYKNRYAHKNCFNASVRAIKKDKDQKLTEKTKDKTVKKARPKAELKEAISEEEYAEKKKYYDYLRAILNDNLSAKIYAISEQMMNRYGFDFKGMYQTIVYLNEIIEKELNGDIVGLIPYYYSEAQEYYVTIEKIEEKNKSFNLKNMYKERIVQVGKNNKKRFKLIDIESI